MTKFEGNVTPWQRENTSPIVSHMFNSETVYIEEKTSTEMTVVISWTAFTGRLHLRNKKKNISLTKTESITVLSIV